MIVLLVNGSPHEKGCTFTALNEIAVTLRQEDVETEFFWIGDSAVPGCMDCGYCRKNGACVYDDPVNRFLKIARQVDGFVFGSPVHFASTSGTITSFMDRAFYSSHCDGHDCFYLKPTTAVVSARRGGATAALDRLNKYFAYAQMLVISSRYWNMVHGTNPDEVLQDLEGLQVMRILGRNMAWFLRCKEAAVKMGVQPPKKEERVMTNFIR